MEAATTVTLNNGLLMPKIALGTFEITDEDIVYKAIVEAGYRSINTSSFNQNEDAIGRILKRVFDETSIKRQDM